MKTLIALILILNSFCLSAMADADLKLMNSARLAYEKNKLDEAIEIYSKISKNSDFWLEALEERAWAYTRKGNYENALADLKSVTHPVLSTQVGPESLMLSAYVSLKTCAYKDALEKVSLFKSRMLPKVDALEALISNPENSPVKNLFSEIKENKISTIALGTKAEKFPRYFHRDLLFTQKIKDNKINEAYSRLKILAQQDLDEIEKNLKKMKLIEIEVIHRVSALPPSMSKKDLKFAKADRNTQLSFPVEGDELWLDEIGKYQVRAQGCKENL